MMLRRNGIRGGKVNKNIKDISTELFILREAFKEAVGGIVWTPISHEFGIYKMNIPEYEAFYSYAEYHFTELQKLIIALIESQNNVSGDA
jgi:hypothetical protein